MDTVVFLDKKVFGKPTDKDHAKEMLKQLSGQEHSVMTGICLCDTREDTPKFTGKTDTAYVKFKDLSDVEIDNYINKFDVLDKAGSYGIQDVKNTFVEEVYGNFDTIVGVPTNELKALLISHDFPA